MYRHQYRPELNGLQLMGTNHWRNLGDDFWNSRGAPHKENRWNWNPERQVMCVVIYYSLHILQYNIPSDGYIITLLCCLFFILRNL